MEVLLESFTTTANVVLAYAFLDFVVTTGDYLLVKHTCSATEKTDEAFVVTTNRCIESISNVNCRLGKASESWLAR